MLLLLLSCAPEPTVETVELTPVVVQPVGSGVAFDDLNAIEDRLTARMNDLEERMGALDIRLMELEARVPGGTAVEVGFDPSRTKLDAHNLQDAIDQMEDRVGRLENNADMGDPGEGLFDIPKDPKQPENPQGPAEPGKQGKAPGKKQGKH